MQEIAKILSSLQSPVDLQMVRCERREDEKFVMRLKRSDLILIYRIGAALIQVVSISTLATTSMATQEWKEEEIELLTKRTIFHTGEKL